MNLWKIIKTQAALALFVAAACTQLAHAGVRPDDRNVGARTSIVSPSQSSESMPSQAALDALGARWNAIAESYGARPASSYYSQAALDAMGQRGQAQAAATGSFDPGALFPNREYPTSAGYVPGADGQIDMPAATPLDPSPTGSGHLVNGRLIAPGEQAQTDVHGALRPDDRGGIRAVDDTQAVAGTTGDGFDWHAAGVGALGAVGTCLLLLGCAFLAASRRKQQSPAVL